ncbi:uncharacterized protein LOC116252147 isoform X2 [Nymphaea colorata]|uniref:uncharacterized protein LOC116252147 isoform X2 n=1 Tax=Nymphaea colorata TaxID=210225 RepID=UPI00214EE561|nr:uncharacterized protein LOC116252147 isoform X2 [Nymphaea colorata]
MVVSLRRVKKLIATASFFISFFLLIAVFVAFQWVDQSISASNWLRNPFRTIGSSQRYLLECPAGKDPGLCPVAPAPVVRTFRPGPACPDYFRWIHEDLRPWKRSGITREMVESGQRLSHFRLVVLDGKAYVETYRRSFQTRDLFTIWGILQLLQWYPGQIPDLDLMFNCEDVPVVQTRYFGDKGLVPPPVFHYCGDDATHDVVFPDWSFWGWPEVNIKPWVPLLEDLNAGNGRVKWKDRDPTAYWRGNPGLPHRQELVKCNLSEWNMRIYVQNWDDEIRHGFKQSNMADQCTHRYKIYVEGIAWSVSRKYILACDSPTLSVKDRYYDFFSRSLMPSHHFWPISTESKCPSIKFAVDWGNTHPQKQMITWSQVNLAFSQELPPTHELWTLFMPIYWLMNCWP